MTDTARARVVRLYLASVLLLIGFTAGYLAAAAAVVRQVGAHCTGMGIVGGAVALECWRSPLAAALLSAIQ